VLSLMLQARYEDGTAMSRSDLADERFTLLAAGHRTTATQLAWGSDAMDCSSVRFTTGPH
jgi:cytochrome P450